MSQHRVALVTGATGVIGPTLVKLLVENGYHVRALARRAPPVGLLPASVEIIRGSITDAPTIAAAVQGVDAVFHLAARLHTNNPGPALCHEYHQSNVEGTRLLTNAAQAAGVGRLVFFSTIAVYGESRPGELFTEDSPLRGDSLYASTKLEAESFVLEAKRLSDAQPLGVVLRCASIYGPRVKGNYSTLIRWLERGWFVPIGSGDNRRTLIHHQDMATAALLAAEHHAAAGRIFNATDGSIHTLQDIIVTIAEALQHRPPRLYLPASVARVSGIFFDGLRQLSGRSPVVGALVSKMLADVAVSGQRIEDVLGFRPKYDLRSGWRETVAQMPQNGSV